MVSLVFTPASILILAREKEGKDGSFSDHLEEGRAEV